jgi:Protein of unknown function (DUF2911)
MKRIFLFTIAFALLVIADAAAQVKLPATSPMQTIRQEFGLGNIEITYSRPSAKKRRVFGDLVPYGKLWRTGANAATKISFSDPVEIIGRKIDSGIYVLYTIPGEETWEIIINKGIKNVGTEGYKESEDVARFKVDPIKLKSKTELFTIQFANIKPDSCEVHLTWEKKLIVIPVTVNIKEKIRTQIDAAMGTKNKPYWQAAQFYYEYDRNLNKALENVNKAVESNPRAYWMFFYRAQIQKDMGDKTGALQSSSRSLDLAKEAKNEDYIKMNQQLQKGLKK